MFSRIAESSIAEVKDRADIVEIISDYVPLKHAGVNFKGKCPFHNEKTPSLIVSPIKQIFHCFGCGEGGNVFSFIMKFEKVSYIESIKILADKLGIILREEKTGSLNYETNKKEIYYKINRIAANFFQYVLLSTDDGKSAREYLDKRKINANMIKKFCIGFCPSNLEKFFAALKKDGLQLTNAEEIGLLGRDSIRNELYPRFKNRLMFPIFDFNGKVSGFGGRITADVNLAKYVNSPESVIYNKGQMLYGLNFAKTNTRQMGYLVLVEGYLDVIQPHAYGVENVVASLGTALTEGQAKLIKRVTDTVVILYDSDIAGMKASDRGIEILLENELYVKIGVLPAGMDPDTFIIEKGRESFYSILEKALDLFSFKLYLNGKTYNKDTMEGKIKIIEQVITTIIKAPSPVQRQEYIKQLAEYIGVDENIIKLEIDKRKLKNVKIKNINSNINNTSSIKLVNNLKHERELLKITLKNPDIIMQILSDLDIEEISDEYVRKVFIFLKNNPSATGEYIISNLGDEEISKLISGLLLEPDSFGDKAEQAAQDFIKKIKQIKIDEKIKILKASLRKAEFEKDEKQRIEISQEIYKLSLANLKQ
ncbi:MAG: DNA primase [Candidatus Firestonebacteria bacterium]|nr:DNA primase [Candidatus Firestonebacteria bacterium]